MADTREDHPHVLVLPPLALLASVLLGAGLEWLRRWPLPLPAGSWIAGVALILIAIVVATWARIEQTRAGTNVNPTRPTTAIVSSGPYRVSRNPMYVSLLLVQLGIAVWGRSTWILLLTVELAALLHAGVVLREERYLDAKFGQVYRDYRSRVRRYV